MNKTMQYLFAIFLPFIIFVREDRPIAALMALALQGCLIGWIPASIWALIVINKKDRSI